MDHCHVLSMLCSDLRQGLLCIKSTYMLGCTAKLWRQRSSKCNLGAYEVKFDSLPACCDAMAKPLTRLQPRTDLSRRLMLSAVCWCTSEFDHQNPPKCSLRYMKRYCNGTALGQITQGYAERVFFMSRVKAPSWAGC